MNEAPALLPLVRKYFESDLASAARALETLPEEEVVEVLEALPAGVRAQHPLRQRGIPARGHLRQIDSGDLGLWG